MTPKTIILFYNFGECMFVAKLFPCERPRETVGERPGDVPMLGQTLAERQDWVVLLCNGRWAKEDEPAQLWIREDAFVSEKALSTFISLAKNASGNVHWKAEGRVGDFVTEISFDDDAALLIWLQEASVYDAQLLQETTELRIDPKMQLVRLPVPKTQFGVDVIELPMSDYIVLPTLHWSQVLWSNLLALGPHLWRELAGTNLFAMFWRFFICVLKARSREFTRIFSQLHKNGSNCRIHPSAVVEGCLLGDDVRIGANAVVRGCILGNGVQIEDLAMVEFAVLSDDTIVQRQAMIKFSVTAPRATVAGVMQMGVLDEDAALKRGAYLMDMTFGDGAKVSWDGQLRRAPLGLVGCCLGQNSILGLGVQVAAGRWVPSDVQIVADPASSIQKLPNEMEGLYKVWNGSVEKL